MILIGQMVSSQTGLIHQVTGDITHMRFYAANILMNHHSDYCYTHLMRETSYEETIWSKEAYEIL